MTRYLISFDDGSMDQIPVEDFPEVGEAAHEEALEWAARFAAACRCAQDVRVIMDDPEV